MVDHSSVMFPFEARKYQYHESYWSKKKYCIVAIASTTATIASIAVIFRRNEAPSNSSLINAAGRRFGADTDWLIALSAVRYRLHRTRHCLASILRPPTLTFWVKACGRIAVTRESRPTCLFSSLLFSESNRPLFTSAKSFRLILVTPRLWSGDKFYLKLDPIPCLQLTLSSKKWISLGKRGNLLD